MKKLHKFIIFFVLLALAFSVLGVTPAHAVAAWTRGTEWQIGSATTSSGQNYGNPDPSSDHTPTADNYVAGVVIGGNASTASLHGYYYLTSPVINTSSAVGTLTFEYYRWLNSDYTPHMQNTIDVWNGTTWVNLWTTGGDPGVQDTSWALQSFNISAYGNANLRVRFGFQIGAAGVYHVSSWNIDDVRIYDTVGNLFVETFSLPTTTSATSTTANGSYNVPDAINITLNFSESISSAAGLTINLNSGGSVTTGALTNVTSYSGTYTVGAGQNSADLTVSSITGTITDAAGNNTTDPTIPAGSNIADSRNIIVDNTASTTSATPVGGPYSAAQSVTLACSDVGGSGCASTLYCLGAACVPATSYAGAININTSDVLRFYSTDNAGNSEGVKTETYTIDTTALIIAGQTLQASYTGTGPLSFTVTFSEDVDNPAGDTDTDDVTNPANYRIINKGANGFLETAACNVPLGGDDSQILPSGVTYIPNTAVVNLGIALPVGTYRLFVCGTTSIVDLAGNALAGNGVTSGTDFTFDFTVGAVASGSGSSRTGTGTGSGDGSGARWLPNTGFAPNVVTRLPAQPAELAYTKMSDLWLEIPSQKVKANIVGVPQSENIWDVKWLGNDAGWLNGTAFPSWEGNSVLTAHVMGADGLPGPFAKLQDLKYGERIVVHMLDQQYVFEVRNKRLVRPDSTAFAFEHLEGASYLTLVTCSGYNEESDTYSFRRLVRAVLVGVK